MRRIQIHIDERMDDELAAEARRRDIAKAALIRSLLSQAMEMRGEDPLDRLVGGGDGEAANDIDALLYGA